MDLGDALYGVGIGNCGVKNNIVGLYILIQYLHTIGFVRIQGCRI